MNKFENYLKNLTKKHKIMLYLSIVFIAAILLNQFLPALMSTQEELQTNISSMQMEILKNSSKRLKRDLAKIKNESLQTQGESAQEQELVNSLMSNLYKVKFAFFRESELAKALNSLLNESIKRDVKINFIKNLDDKIPNISELIQYKKSMQIDGVSQYRNLLIFINYVEHLDLLFTIQDLKIEQSEDNLGVHFSIILNFYGVGL